MDGVRTKTTGDREMNVGSCEQRNCEYWCGTHCTDEVIYVNENNGEECCRYHPDAVLSQETHDGK